MTTMRAFRKTITPALEIAAIFLVILDIGLGVGLGWLSARVSEQKHIEATANARLRQAQLRVTRLQAFDDILPRAEGQLTLFLKKRVPPRRQAYSRALHLVRVITQGAGVQLASVGYKWQPNKDAPLDRLDLTVSVSGTFDNLMKFSHSLETATEFLVLRGFSLELGENEQLVLKLSADLYMNP